MWHWTKVRLATILRTGVTQISDEWPLHPICDVWPPTKRRAVLWILAHFVYFRATLRARVTLMDYADFMRRARWKVQVVPQRVRFLGQYLEVL
jgi:hypothetical protein